MSSQGDTSPAAPAPTLPTFRFTDTPEFICCGRKQRSYSCAYCGPKSDRDTRGNPL